MCFLSTTFQNAPAHPSLYFLTSSLEQQDKGANHFTFGGSGKGGGAGVDFKKNISCKCICVRKKIPAQDHRPKKNSRTYSEVEKKFWQDVPWADTLNFCISKLLKDFSI